MERAHPYLVEPRSANCRTQPTPKTIRPDESQPIMTKYRQTLGRDGEARAAQYLEAQGYQIVARNVRAGGVEIDLIARGRPGLVIVEVKTRRATGSDGFGSHGRAAESVDEHKQRRLRRGAWAWLEEHPLEARRARQSGMRGPRFDVITCIRLGKAPLGAEIGSQNDDTSLPAKSRWSIEHWEAAF